METKKLDRNNKISKVHSGEITAFYRFLQSIQYVRRKSLYYVNIFIDFSGTASHPEKLIRGI